MNDSLWLAVNRLTSRQGRIFSVVTNTLIILSMVVMTLDSSPDISVEFRAGLGAVELVVTLLFTIEFLVRLWYASSRAAYMRFWGLVDLLAILPIWLALVLGEASLEFLEPLRALRLLRLLKLLRVPRVAAATDRFYLAYRIAREEIFVFLFAAILVIFIAGTGIYHFEHEVQPEKFRSIIDSLWWAIASLTTVGYGDVYPITSGGRIFTFVILLVGLGVVSAPSGLIASALSEARRQIAEESAEDRVVEDG